MCTECYLWSSSLFPSSLSLMNFLLWQLMKSQYPPPYSVFSFYYGPTHLKTPSLTIPILWQSTSASSIECVVMMIALLPQTSAKISQSCHLFSGSSPVEGSSRKIILGSPTNEIATLSLLLIPPDSYQLSLLACLVKYTSFIACSASFFSSAGLIPFNQA